MEINFYWCGFEIPALCRECMYSWREHGYTPVLWSEGAVFKLPGIVSRDSRDIGFENRGELPAITSDGFRYKLLAERGGIWCDSDILCLKKMPELSGTSFFSEQHVDGGNLPTSCFIYAEENCPIARELWERYKRVPRPMTWGDTGPSLVNYVAKKLRVNTYQYKLVCPVSWWEFEKLGLNDFSLDFPDSFAIHFWHELWKRKGGFETAGHKSPIWNLINKQTH